MEDIRGRETNKKHERNLYSSMLVSRALNLAFVARFAKTKPDHVAYSSRLESSRTLLIDR